MGKKLRMGQVFSKDGERFPVTEILAGPCVVAFERTDKKDGYLALGLGFGKKKKRETFEFLREVKLKDLEEKVPVGTKITVDQIIKPGDLVDITGTSKGLGFTGVVKRYHFRGGPRTHGQSDRERAPGSIGQTTTPGRVYKGKRMAGKEGGKRKTVKNLLVLSINEAEGKILVKGAVPGKPKGLLIIKKSKEGKNTPVELQSL